VPKAGWPREQIENLERTYTQVLFLCKPELGFFHFLEIVTGWLVRSAGQMIPVQPGWYFPPQKILLAENRFLQAGKGTENTKEKSRQCFAYVGKLLGGYQVGRSMWMAGTELTTSVRYGTGIQ